VARLNDELRYEQRIYAIVIAGEQFSIDNGMLNAQYKLKRAHIGRHYAGDLDMVYQKHDVYNDGTVIDAHVVVLAAVSRPAAERAEAQ
jgi:long-chain acyl-CoA synthetase